MEIINGDILLTVLLKNIKFIPSLFWRVRWPWISNNKRETAKEVEQEMENRLNRKKKSWMERLIPGFCLKVDSTLSFPWQRESSERSVWYRSSIDYKVGFWIPDQVGNDTLW